VSELLWAAVDELTKPRHVRLLRDGGSSDWTTLPSLWWQLEEAAANGAESNGTGRGSRYRTPIDLDCLELATSIRDVTVDALAGHDQKPRSTLPDSVRALASVVTAVNDDDLTGWWTYRVRSWCRQIQTALHLTEQPQPRRIRDTRCPTCQATHVTIVVDGEAQRVPALLIDFADRLIRAASCTACGSSWFRGEALLALADELATRRPTAVTRVYPVC
jgi:hypothetical protein